MQLSLSKLGELETRYSSAKASLKRVREEAQETVMTVVRSAEVTGMAFALGIVNGRWSRPEVLGVPVDLGTGIVSHVLGFVLDDKAGSHLHNLGDGAVASYVTTLGVGIGQKMLTEAKS